jgi:Tfp pilus assembly protein PilV
MFQDFCNTSSIKTFKGYTLLEIAIAILFFSITVVCLSLPISQSISLSASEQDAVNANNLAKVYLKSIELKWQFQADYDIGELPPITSTLTDNGRYTVTVTNQEIARNSSDIIILKRINVKYKDRNNNNLADLFTDINRPESVIK